MHHILVKQKLLKQSLCVHPRNAFYLAYNAPKWFGGRAPHGAAGAAHIAPPDSLTGFKGRVGKSEKGGRERKGEKREGQGRGKRRRKGKGVAYTK